MERVRVERLSDDEKGGTGAWRRERWLEVEYFLRAEKGNRKIMRKKKFFNSFQV